MDTDVHSLAEASGSRSRSARRSRGAAPGHRVPTAARARRRAPGTFGVTSDPNLSHDRPRRTHLTFGTPGERQPELAAWPAPDTYETPDASGPRTKLLAMLLVVAALTAGLVVLAGGAEAFWLCLPGTLLVAASAASRLIAVARAATVVMAAVALALLTSRPLPAAPLVAIVPAASLLVLMAMRTRLERDRDALRRSALTDPLTGIANRRSLLERIDYEISRHARGGHRFALVLIDLDGFKALNDRFGHSAGDDLLREAAAALRHTVRAQDTAARIGGDEFCVLAPETHGAGIAQLEARINQAVAQVTAGVEALSASTGSAVFPDDGRSAPALMAAADTRLLAAKRALPRGRDDRRAA